MPRFSLSELRELQSEYLPSAILKIQTERSHKDPSMAAHIHSAACQHSHSLISKILPDCSSIYRKLSTWADRPALFEFKHRRVSSIGIGCLLFAALLLIFMLKFSSLLTLALMLSGLVTLVSLGFLASPIPLLEEEQEVEELDEEEQIGVRMGGGHNSIKLDLSHYFVSPEHMERATKHAGKTNTCSL